MHTISPASGSLEISTTVFHNSENISPSFLSCALNLGRTCAARLAFKFSVSNWCTIALSAFSGFWCPSRPSLKKKYVVVEPIVVLLTWCSSIRHLERTDFPQPGSADTQRIRESVASRQSRNFSLSKNHLQVPSTRFGLKSFCSS